MTRTHDRRRRRRLTLLIAGGVLGAAAAFLAVGLRTSWFVATVSIVLNPVPGNPYSSVDQGTLVNLGTEAQVARSDAVVNSVAGRSSAPADPEIIRRRLTVAVQSGGVITVSFKATTRLQAQRVALALSQATLNQRATQGRDWFGRQVRSLRSRIRAAQVSLAQAQDPQVSRLIAQRIIGYRAELDNVLATPLTPGDVVSTAAYHPSTLPLRAAAAAVGGLLGLGVVAGASALRRRRRRVGSPPQVAVAQQAW